jgi:hypothetical protein
MNFQGYDPADLLLSPRLTVTGGDPGSSLEGVNTSKLADGSLCVVQGTPNTVYQLQKALTAGGIAPKAGPGRWFPLTVTAPLVSNWTVTGEWTPPFVCWPFTDVVVGGTNTSTGVATPFGTPVSTTPANYQVIITTSGIEGTAIFSLTSTIAATITGITVPAGAGLYVVPGTGITIQFTAGTYDITDTWDWSTVFADLGNGTFTGNYRVVGDSADVRLNFIPGSTTDFGGGVGTPTSQGITWPFPPGFQLDPVKIPALAPNFTSFAFQLYTGLAPVGTFPVFVFDYGTSSNAVVSTAILGALPVGTLAMLETLGLPMKP